MKRAIAGGILGLAGALSVALAGGAWAEGRAASRGAVAGGMVDVAVPQTPKTGGAMTGGAGPAVEEEQRFDGKLGWGSMKGFIDGPHMSESAPFLFFWKGEAARRGGAQPPQAPAAATAQAATGRPGCAAAGGGATGASSGRCTK